MSAASRIVGTPVKAILREASYITSRLVDDHTLEIFSLEITTSKRAAERGHNAFLMGTEIGACEGKSWLAAERPSPPRVLELVR